MMLSAVLAELEVACGQDVDHIFEKRFSGDFRMGLKVLGNISREIFRSAASFHMLHHHLFIFSLDLCCDSTVHSKPLRLPGQKTDQHQGNEEASPVGTGSFVL